MADLNEVVEKTVEVTEPIVKEVVKKTYSLKRDLAFYTAGIVSAICGTKFVGWIKNKKTDKSFFKKDEVVAESDYKEVNEEVQENIPEE